MSLYECNCCGYESRFKNDLVRHIARQTRCIDVDIDIIPEIIKKTLSKTQCKHCKKMYSVDFLKKHQKNSCKAKYVKLPIPQNLTPTGVIYIMHLREFLETNVYKIGRTRELLARTTGYPKGSKILYACVVNDPLESENQIKNLFAKRFVQRTDYGSEYFEGDLSTMIQMLKVI